jgi:hypothetical protein
MPKTTTLSLSSASTSTKKRGLKSRGFIPDRALAVRSRGARIGIKQGRSVARTLLDARAKPQNIPQENDLSTAPFQLKTKRNK